MRRPQAYPVDESVRRTRLGLRVDRLPGQPPAHLARPHRRRQARAGVGQGAHRRIRRRPRLRGDHRRLGRRASVRAGRADARRPAVPARFRGRRHLGGGSGSRSTAATTGSSTKGPGRREFVSICCSGSSSRSGSTEHLQVYRDASPITQVRPDAPPFFVLHGVDDSLIPAGEAREFVAALKDSVGGDRRVRRNPARTARFRLLRVTARLLHRPAVEQFLVGARHAYVRATGPSPSRPR